MSEVEVDPELIASREALVKVHEQSSVLFKVILRPLIFFSCNSAPEMLTCDKPFNLARFSAYRIVRILKLSSVTLNY